MNAQLFRRIVVAGCLLGSAALIMYPSVIHTEGLEEYPAAYRAEVPRGRTFRNAAYGSVGAATKLPTVFYQPDELRVLCEVGLLLAFGGMLIWVFAPGSRRPAKVAAGFDRIRAALQQSP